MNKTANTSAELNEILSKISFAPSCVDFDWTWQVQELLNSPSKTPMGWLINTKFKRPDINTGLIGEGKGRELYIPVGATASAVFFTCWILVELIVKHELMEAIRFDGKRVLNPHHTLDELSLPDMLKNWPAGPVSIDGLHEALRNEFGDSN